MRKRPTKTKGASVASAAPMMPVTTGKAVIGFILGRGKLFESFDASQRGLGIYQNWVAAVCAVHDANSGGKTG